MSKTREHQHLDPMNRPLTPTTTRSEILMKILNQLLLTLVGASQSVYNAVQTRRQNADRLAAQRGSLTLEQIIWTVGIAIVALAIVAIVVAAINSKAGELPL